MPDGESSVSSSKGGGTEFMTHGELIGNYQILVEIRLFRFQSTTNAITVSKLIGMNWKEWVGIPKRVTYVDVHHSSFKI